MNRPLRIHVEHQDLDGQRRITDFDRGTARQVAHESDHLNGVLYTHRMDPGREPIPVSEYRQGGQDWIAHGQPAVEQLDRRITRAEHRVAELETHARVRQRWLAERSSL